VATRQRSGLTVPSTSTRRGLAGLAGLLAAAVAGVLVVRRTLRPLERVAATATRVTELPLASGEVSLAERVPETDTDPRTEVGRVGTAMNRLLDHVEESLHARQASETQVRQFVADASHELRTPLASIRGYAEFFHRQQADGRPPTQDDVAHMLRRVEAESLRMSALVDDLLLLARLDAGRDLELGEVDLTVLVLDAVSDARVAGPGHRWEVGVPPVAVLLSGDAARLHQVVANLLANVRTHTPEGTTATVRLTVEGGTAVLEVTDDGPGIPEQQQPQVFERFARGDASRSRAAGSTGLGLAIVAAVVAAHDGSVAVRSRPGETVFTVRLPGAVLGVPETDDVDAEPVDAATGPQA
jgi:two-component system, OmpR family, sensor kinase